MDATKAKAEAMAARPDGTVPPWAANLTPSISTDGRLWLLGKEGGATVAVQPEAWSKMTFDPDGPATSAARPDAGSILFAQGVNLPPAGSSPGQLRTNDPGFGGAMLGTAECRRDCPPAPASAADSPFVISAALVAAGLVAAALVRRRRP